MSGLGLAACGDDSGQTSSDQATATATSTDTATTGTSETTGTTTDASTTDTGTESDAATCSDGDLDPGEECDDGNAMDGDGCNNDCKPSGRELWTTLLDDTWIYSAVSAVTASADDRVFVGGVVQDGAGDDAWLAELDPEDGSFSWAQAYDFGGNEWALGVAVASDQLIAVGSRRLDSRNPLLLGVSPEDGGLLWEQLPMTEGDAYLTAITHGLGAAVTAGLLTREGVANLWISQLEADGQAAWSQEYPWLPPTALFPLGPGIAGFDDQVVAGYRRLSEGEQRETLVALGPAGQELWTTEATDATGMIYGVAAGQDAILTASIVFPQNLAVRRFSRDGALDWPSADCQGIIARGVAEAPDETVVAIGLANNGSDDIRLCKFSATGTLLWERTIDGGERDLGYGVTVLSDGTIVAVGESQVGGQSRGWIAGFSP